jgi:hypothetical protein
MASLIAQSYDCYRLAEVQAPLAKVIMESASYEGWTDIGSLSNAMLDSAPFVTFGIVPVDIDQSGAFPPSVGTVTAARATTDDMVFIDDPVIDESTGLLGLCMEMESELSVPYGEGVRVCLFENGEVTTDNPDPVTFDKTRLVQNMATVLNQYFMGSSRFAEDVVAKAASLTTPTQPVEKKATVEEQGIMDIIINHGADRQKHVQNRHTAVLSRINNIRYFC